ncbi:MAG: hypothetical protein AAF604_23285 [Acidobacteriota bacterium]
MTKRAQIVLSFLIAVGLASVAWGQITTFTPGTTVGTPTTYPIQIHPQSMVQLAGTMSQSSYSWWETVRIDLTLTNQGFSAIGLCPDFEGNIRVVSLKRDGVAIAPRLTWIDFDEDLGWILNQNLETVPRGGSLSLSWESGYDQVSGEEALEAVIFNKTTDLHQESIYPIGTAGTYEIKLRYRYPASTRFSTPVFTGSSNTITLTFTIL